MSLTLFFFFFYLFTFFLSFFLYSIAFACKKSNFVMRLLCERIFSVSYNKKSYRNAVRLLCERIKYLQKNRKKDGKKMKKNYSFLGSHFSGSFRLFFLQYSSRWSVVSGPLLALHEAHKG